MIKKNYNFCKQKKSKNIESFANLTKKRLFHTLNCKGKNNNINSQNNAKRPKFYFLSIFRKHFWRIIFINHYFIEKKRILKKYFLCCHCCPQFFIDVFVRIFCNIYFIKNIYLSELIPTFKKKRIFKNFFKNFNFGQFNVWMRYHQLSF